MRQTKRHRLLLVGIGLLAARCRVLHQPRGSLSYAAPAGPRPWPPRPISWHFVPRRMGWCARPVANPCPAQDRTSPPDSHAAPQASAFTGTAELNATLGGVAPAAPARCGGVIPRRKAVSGPAARPSPRPRQQTAQTRLSGARTG